MKNIPGLSQIESKVYSSIIKLNNASVRDISKRTGIHRTYIYDVLEKLKERGLISFYLENKVAYYKAADPINLYNYLEEQKNKLDELMPLLKKDYLESASEIDVEVFKGKGGLESVYKDILRENSPVKGFGISRKMKEYMPIFREQFFREVEKKKLKFELIYTKKLEKLDKPFVSKYLQEEFESPIEVLIYADKTLQIIWEPDMRAILIKSKKFSDTYRNHFQVLWNQAKSM